MCISVYFFDIHIINSLNLHSCLLPVMLHGRRQSGGNIDPHSNVCIGITPRSPVRPFKLTKCSGVELAIRSQVVTREEKYFAYVSIIKFV